MSRTHELTAINADYVCRLKCEVCEEYFDCTYTERENIYQRDWMLQVFLPIFNLPEFIEVSYLKFWLMYFHPFL